MALNTMLIGSLLLAAASPSEQAARQLILELDDGKASEAFQRLGVKMQAAITGEALVATWKQATSTLGTLQGIDALQTLERQGLQVFILAVHHEHGGLQVTAAVDPATLKVEGFFLKPLTADAGKPAPKAPPASYVHLDTFTSVELTVGKAPFELPATLCVPKGAGPFPAVVLVHGSGPNDRDESIGGNKPFKDLAEGLASAGIVALRYDKRTFAHGKDYIGKPITMNEEVIDDAVSALGVLAGRREVDPKRLVVLGHSLGALLAPEIATRAHLAGAVLLAPPARKPWDIIPQQLTYLGAPAAEISKVKQAFAEIRSGKATGTVMNAPVAYWKEWASKDGIAVAKKLKVPVLVLRGSRDYQVIEEDLTAWKKGLAGVPGDEVLELPGLNHLFIAGDGKPSPAEYETPGHVAPVVLERVSAFVLAR